MAAECTAATAITTTAVGTDTKAEAPFKDRIPASSIIVIASAAIAIA